MDGSEEWLRFDRSRLGRMLLGLDLHWLNPKYTKASRGLPARLLHFGVGLLRGPWLSAAIRRDRERARKLLAAFPHLDALHRSYQERSRSRGVEVSDFVRLYIAVRRLAPRFVLECGTGMSTIALGAALKDNARDGGGGMCISMEDVPEWSEHARSLLPAELSRFVEIVLSPRVEIECAGTVGVGYREIPDHAYDFVFVDGPQQLSPVSGNRLFSADVIRIACDRPRLWGLIDNRLETVRRVSRALRGSHHAWYDPVSKLGYLRPRSRSIAGPG